MSLTKIVVGKDGDHNTPFIAHSDLESLPAMVKLIGITPAHTSLLLSRGGLVHMRESHIPFLHHTEMRCQHNASRSASPVGSIESGVVVGQARIASVAEDALYEVKVCDATTGNKVTQLQALLRQHSGNLRAHQRPDMQACQSRHRLGPVGGERKHVQVVRRDECSLEKARECHQRNRNFISRDGQSIVCNVERVLGGALVTQRVVKHAVRDTVAEDFRVLEGIRIIRKGQFPGNTITVNAKRVGRDLNDFPVGFKTSLRKSWIRWSTGQRWCSSRRLCSR